MRDARNRGRRVLLVSIDDLRSDAVGVHPDRRRLAAWELERSWRTPTFDALARGGTFFSRCFTAAPYTTASHASILTGCLQRRHGVREYYRNAISDQVRTLFELFQDAGYTTVLATDFPLLLGRQLGFTRGVDRHLSEDDEELFSLLRDRDSQDLFVFVHFGSVHAPFGLTSLRLDGDHFGRQVEAVAERAGVPPQGRVERTWLERHRSPREHLLRQRYLKAVETLYSEERYDELMALYFEGVEYFDTFRFDRFVCCLEEAGWLDDAVIAVLADHGEEYSDRAYGHHNSLCDGVVNVPLLVRGPGLAQGVVSDGVCRTVDVAPTLCDLAGLDARQSPFDGASLSPVLAQGPGAGDGRVACGETWLGNADRIMEFMELCDSSSRLMPARSLATRRVEYVRDERWKLVVETDLVRSEEEVRLYDTEADPEERQDVAPRQADVVAAMNAWLGHTREETADPVAPRVGPRDLARLGAELRDLGYLR